MWFTMALDEKEIISKLARLEGDVKTLFNSIEKIEKLTDSINKLATDMQMLATQVRTQNGFFEKIIEGYETRLKDQGTRIGNMENRGARKWDSIVDKVLMLGIGGLATYFFSKLFLGG
jgi:uncharacterized protein (UPF0335 family)